MPWLDNPSQKGNLYIKFNIEFPKTLTEEQKKVYLIIFK